MAQTQAQWQWQLCRQVIDHPAAQHRWDLAYQLLLEWSTSQPCSASCISVQTPTANEVVNLTMEEVTGGGDDESSGLCQGIEPKPG